MFFKCKKDCFIEHYCSITSNDYYFVCEENDEIYSIIDDMGRGLIISKTKDKDDTYIFFEDYFYTKLELRKLRISKLLNEAKM